jgi:hypothetical protein
MSRRTPPPGPVSSRPIGPILAAARTEAELAQHGYIGLEHLLITLTQSKASATAPLLAEHGITTQRTRDAVWLVVGSGRGDGPRFDPASLLATLGIDLEQIRRHVESQFGPNAIPPSTLARSAGTCAPADRCATSGQARSSNALSTTRSDTAGITRRRNCTNDSCSTPSTATATH